MKDSPTFRVRANRTEHLVGLVKPASRAARFLEAAVVASLNVLVSGGTQSDNLTSV